MKLEEMEHALIRVSNFDAESSKSVFQSMASSKYSASKALHIDISKLKKKGQPTKPAEGTLHFQHGYLDEPLGRLLGKLDSKYMCYESY
jgi:hypothetical protein